MNDGERIAVVEARVLQLERELGALNRRPPMKGAEILDAIAVERRAQGPTRIAEALDLCALMSAATRRK